MDRTSSTSVVSSQKACHVSASTTVAPGSTDDLHFHEKLRHTFATLALESRALDMHEQSRAMGHASLAIPDKAHAHVRPRDFSAHRAVFSAHISAASAPSVALRSIDA